MPVNENYIREMKSDRELHFAALHKQIRACRSLRYFEHDVDIPDAYKTTTKKVYQPLVPDVLLRVVAALTDKDPIIRVPPSGQTETAQNRSSLMERFTSAMLRRLQEEANRRVLDMGIDSACGSGMGVWKSLYQSEAWDGEPRRRRKQGKELIEPENDGDEPTYKRYWEYEDAGGYNERREDWRKSAPMPITWHDLDPLCYLPVMHGNKVEEVLEVTQRRLIPAMKAFGVRRRDDGKFEKLRVGESFPESEANSARVVTCIEHWDSTHVTYVLDNEIVDQVKHGYPELPYFHFAGFSTSGPKPEHQYQSIIENFRHLVPHYDRLLTMTMSWAFLSAWPYLVADPGADLGQVDGLAPPVSIAGIQPGAILSGVKVMELPGVNKSLEMVLQMFQSFIDRSSIAAVMYGQGAGISSGYMARELLTAAQMVYRPIIKEAMSALVRLVRFWWKVIELKHKTGLYVWGDSSTQGARDWLKLSPEDINGYYAVEAEMEPLLPSDEVIQGQYASAMVQGGLWSRRRGMEHVGVEDPEGENRQILVERFRDHPEVQNKLILDAAQAAGLYEPQPPTPPPPQGPMLYGPNGEPLPIGPAMNIPGAMPGMPTVGEVPVPGMNQPVMSGPGMARPAGAERLPPRMP